MLKVEAQQILVPIPFWEDLQEKKNLQNLSVLVAWRGSWLKALEELTMPDGKVEPNYEILSDHSLENIAFRYFPAHITSQYVLEYVTYISTSTIFLCNNC